jgi:hypothetical protein
MELLPRISLEEILAALEAVQQARARMQQVVRGEDAAAQKTVDSTRSEMAQRLEQLAQDLADQALKDVSGIVRRLGRGGDSGEQARELGTALELAAKLLARHLLATKLEREVRLSRRTTTPPEKYRDLVDRYFRALSEGE